MIRQSTFASPACSDPVRPHRALSLLGLAELISDAGDRPALEEFHAHRPAFRLNGRGPLLFVEFVDLLRQGPSGRQFAGCEAGVLDRAYDLTIDKYTRLADGRDRNPSTNRSGPDCRGYFRSVTEHVHTWKHRHPRADELRVEAVVAQTLQRRAVRHFHLGCLEAWRSVNRARSRYAWQLDHGVLYVWLPVWLRGLRRRNWLEANVDNPDPSRPGEKRRVQAIVDGRLGVFREVSLGDGVSKIPARPSNDQPLSWLLQREITIRGLAKVVAEEKAHTLSRQRPAIRALGKPDLRRLVLRIFEDLSQECYRDHEVAQAFHLSKATFSRFAGSLWDRHAHGPIPDLWANAARVLACHEPFAEAAREIGIWPQVRHVLRAAHEETQS